MEPGADRGRVRSFHAAFAPHQVPGQGLPCARGSGRRRFSGALDAHRIPGPQRYTDAGPADHEHGIYTAAADPGGADFGHYVMVPDPTAPFRTRVGVAESSPNGNLPLS